MNQKDQNAILISNLKSNYQTEIEFRINMFKIAQFFWLNMVFVIGKIGNKDILQHEIRSRITIQGVTKNGPPKHSKLLCLGVHFLCYTLYLQLKGSKGQI